MNNQLWDMLDQLHYAGTMTSTQLQQAIALGWRPPLAIRRTKAKTKGRGFITNNEPEVEPRQIRRGRAYWNGRANLAIAEGNARALADAMAENGRPHQRYINMAYRLRNRQILIVLERFGIEPPLVPARQAPAVGEGFFSSDKPVLSFPGEKHMHGNFCGPGTDVRKRLKLQKQGQSLPIDGVDSACMKHDLNYVKLRRKKVEGVSKEDLKKMTADVDDRFIRDVSRADGPFLKKQAIKFAFKGKSLADRFREDPLFVGEDKGKDPSIAEYPSRQLDLKGSGAGKLTTTTASELQQMGSSLANLRIFPVDKLPRKLTNGSYIINADESSGPGTHWTGLYSGKNQKYTIIYDSFGMPPDDRILRLAKSGTKPVVALNGQIQDLKSSACGYYVVDFLKAMASGKSPARYLVNWDGEDQNDNEKLLSRRVKKK
jgi:hypothetical protein